MIGKSTIERDEATKGKLIDTNRAHKKYNEPISMMGKPQSSEKVKLSSKQMEKKSFLNVI